MAQTPRLPVQRLILPDLGAATAWLRSAAPLVRLHDFHQDDDGTFFAAYEVDPAWAEHVASGLVGDAARPAA